MPRFNPCFRGCRSGTGIGDPFLACLDLFQSLFSWMSLWNIEWYPRALSSAMGFNPCFRGCRSGTADRRTVGIRFRRFQSLFSWMSLWNLVFAALTEFHCTRFQSLFSWMSLWNDGPPRLPSRKKLVSILVFVDVALELGIGMVLDTQRESFNPCFRGCRSGTTPVSSRKIRLLIGFNPCFRGCRSGTTSHTHPHIVPPRFQSLFSWMSLWNVGDFGARRWRFEFQSLFSWMSLWNVRC